MKSTVFYSWQSDLPPDDGKEFVRGALQDAIALLAECPSLVVRPEIDHDTQGVPGSPPMVAAILQKIDACSIFVGDVSLTFRRDVPGPERHAPNPNVLLELGYAIKRLGHERVLLLLNSSFGSAEQLPFDLRANRIISFEPGNRPKLTEDLRTALSLILTTVGPPPDVLPPVEITLTREDGLITSALHRYQLPVTVTNTGERVLTNWAVEVVFPREVLDADTERLIVRELRDSRMAILRCAQSDSGEDSVYPGEEKVLIRIGYYMNDKLYNMRADLFDRDVTATFYVGAERVARHGVKFRVLQCY